MFDDEVIEWVDLSNLRHKELNFKKKYKESEKEENINTEHT